MNIIIKLLIICFIFILLKKKFLYNNDNFGELTKKINKIYYINLDRRQDRNQHFIDQCNKFNFNMNDVIRFNAIDGLNYKFSKKELNMFKNADYLKNQEKFKIMGNQLSHYYILKDMIKNNYNYIIIFQDDVILRYDFNSQINKLLKNIPDDAEIINFGFHKNANLKNFKAINFFNSIETHTQCKKYVNNFVCIIKNNINPCSLAYLVTLKGAKNLVNYFNKVGFLKATDWNYNNYLISKNINYATRIILCTGNSNFESDIFK